MSDVFIAGTATAFPKPISSREVADKFYPPHLCSDRTVKLARRLANSFGIKTRTVCLDLERIPEKVLSSPANHPVLWCSTLIEQLSSIVRLTEIGYVGVAYNTTLHTNSLPNLACQAAMRCGINPEVAPEEFAHYGCAGGFFPLENAIQYCKRNEKAAIVIVFDQCTSAASFCYDQNDPLFTMDLKVNLLFSDGAAAVLVIPERMRNLIAGLLPKIEYLLTGFHLSDVIRFDDRRFIVGDTVKDTIPSLVSRSVIKPILSKQRLLPEHIREWSIHQGGSEVLERFRNQDTLGLTDLQLTRSNELFVRFGNLSAPSCFFVFDSLFRESSEKDSGQLGMIVGFGAGFYHGAVLYRWV